MHNQKLTAKLRDLPATYGGMCALVKSMDDAQRTMLRRALDTDGKLDAADTDDDDHDPLGGSDGQDLYDAPVRRARVRARS